MPAIHIQSDATLNSTPDTVLWGYIAANLPPALTIKSGQIVQIEALPQQGLTRKFLKVSLGATPLLVHALRELDRVARDLCKLGRG